YEVHIKPPLEERGGGWGGGDFVPHNIGQCCMYLITPKTAVNYKVTFLVNYSDFQANELQNKVQNSCRDVP
ncbi:MAG: hypothetical protein ACKOQS_04575, partial [Dolichospermum sp.]